MQTITTFSCYTHPPNESPLRLNSCSYLKHLGTATWFQICQYYLHFSEISRKITFLLLCSRFILPLPSFISTIRSFEATIAISNHHNHILSCTCFLIFIFGSVMHRKHNNPMLGYYLLVFF